MIRLAIGRVADDVGRAIFSMAGAASGRPGWCVTSRPPSEVGLAVEWVEPIDIDDSEYWLLSNLERWLTQRAFIPLMKRRAIARRRCGRSDPGRARCWRDELYSNKAIPPTSVDVTSRPSSPSLPIRLGYGSKGGPAPAFDVDLDKQRNTVKRPISRLWQHRAVAIRYDKRDFTYPGTVDVGIRDPVA